MAWNGPPARCTLQTDLTRYHSHLTAGAKGVLVPKIQTTKWGVNDRFGAVKFDCCGHTLDIVLDNLVIENGARNPSSQIMAPVPKKDRDDVLTLLGDIDD